MAESTNRQLPLFKRSIFDKCAKKVNGEQVLVISKSKFNVLKRILSNFVNFQWLLEWSSYRCNLVTIQPRNAKISVRWTFWEIAWIFVWKFLRLRRCFKKLSSIQSHGKFRTDFSKLMSYFDLEHVIFNLFRKLTCYQCVQQKWKFFFHQKESKGRLLKFWTSIWRLDTSRSQVSVNMSIWEFNSIFTWKILQ